MRTRRLLVHARGLAVLVAVFAVAEGAARLARLPVPGSIVGMLALTAALRLGWVRVATVRAASGLLLRWMGLFFVAAGVGILAHLDLVRDAWLPVAAASLASTVAVLAVVGVLRERAARDG